MRYWLIKSEPKMMSFDDLLDMPQQTVDWWGVRNYQARNFMRDQMQLGDKIFFFHSSCQLPGIAGICQVVRLAYPDQTQFDPKSRYFDPKSSDEDPRWFNVDVQALKKTLFISLNELRLHSELSNMRVLARGNRLSITPIDPKEWTYISKNLMQETL